MIRRTLTGIWAALAVALLILGAGCAPRGGLPDGAVSSKAVWKRFRQEYCHRPAEPAVLIKGSLYYTRVEPTRRTNRTILTMWGDFDGPMRLDLAAGMGKLLAHIREDKEGLLVYYPTEDIAYSHGDAMLGATSLGMPFPFSLAELARVCSGDFSGLVTERPESVAEHGDLFMYTLKGSVARTITVDGSGQPVSVTGTTPGARTWELSIDQYDEEGEAVRPERLTLTMDNGEKGALRIRARELKLAAWDDRALKLPLPDGVEVKRLDGSHSMADHKE